MIKTILLIALGLFFILNGLNHFFNKRMVEEYAEKHRLFLPKISVLLSGILLVGGGITLMTGFLRIYGIIGLSIFLLVASFTIHQFWREPDRDSRMIEGLHFMKNIAILIELIYIATTT